VQLSEILILFVLFAAQLGIVLAIRQRFFAMRGRATFLFWIAVGSLFAVAVLALVLSLNPRFAAFFRPMRTAILLWLLPAAPAFVLYRIFLRLGRIPVNPDRRQLIRTAGVAAMAAPFAIEAWGAFVTRFDYKIQEVDLPIAGLHPDLAGLRLLQISDIHLSPFLSERELARVIDASNELRPQIAFMTGDLISSWGDPVDACIRQLSRIKADAPLLGCLGNHEMYVQVERYTQQQAALRGMTFLRHQRRELRFGNGVLNIAGIDYQPSARRGRYLRYAKPLIAPHATNILLSHNPDVFTEAPEQGWQAMLAGHTHGGQVTVEILSRTVNVARFLTRYVTGLYLERGAACYVTRGIGTIGIPARVGATPEITLLRLRRAA